MPGSELDTAYAIDGPDGARRLYADWAGTYDESFGAAYGYVAPREVARIYRELGADAPVLDVGAGTGLVAAHLGGIAADALDISPEMLAVAAGKGLYRATIEADLTQALPLGDGVYRGVISAGTFTHGHVGAGALPELLRVAAPGALFVCGTKPDVFDQMGFGSALALLQAADRITPLRFFDIPIYEGADHPHAGDRGLVMTFRKA
ncbi:class I SAM-dependent DNA methyltransferase [Roseicyclus persicicus]|uniref:Class I SAM-dependent methyltransferase n=1 Tax=Roseicyclus persicicus TaxID=2650661 RepID=A0A7X6JXF2_9RHOB|nr:class I SAM-dependent methyltransferase [Roseibacterium persicicum]NKX43334.1 class I SAM-dependent methyltransferase [Roseibacterium persicicum]